ncbi:polyprenyl diphosphate synthase [Chloroflexota bacterium]
MLSNVNNLPQHVAIIMDGNRRWAKQHRLPRLKGHQTGANNIRHVVEVFAEYNLRYLTLFAFSTENWGRPRSEVNGLLRILRDMIDHEVKLLHEKDVRVLYLGRLDRLSAELRHKVERAIELTKNNTKMTLIIAFDYGARTEIVDAVHCLLADKLSPEEVDESSFAKYLYLPEIPDPDLIIRTGGERRLSNFLLWQAVYSELYFTDVLWPDFGATQIEEALVAYASQQRRFGKA